MRIVILSKRNMKKALSRNVDRYGISTDTWMKLNGTVGVVINGTAWSKRCTRASVYDARFKGFGCTWHIPQHFVRKVLK